MNPDPPNHLPLSTVVPFRSPAQPDANQVSASLGDQMGSKPTSVPKDHWGMPSTAAVRWATRQLCASSRFMR